MAISEKKDQTLSISLHITSKYVIVGYKKEIFFKKTKTSYFYSINV